VTDTTKNHDGKRRLIATMKTIIVSTCGHALRIRALPIAFKLLNRSLIICCP
jgi:hypothetical protein